MPATPRLKATRALTIDQLTGREKAAVLLMALGPEAAAEVTKDLQPDDLEAISLEIARLDGVSASLAEAVLEEWSETQRAAVSLAAGGVGYAREILVRALGPDRAAAVLARIEAQIQDSSGLYDLRRVDPQQLGSVLRAEHPQTIALVLAHLDTTQTAAVLRDMDPTVGADVIHRMARMDKVMPEVLEVIRTSVGGTSELSLSQELRAAGGPAPVAQVMNLLAGTLEKDLMQRLSERDGELAEEIKNLMFVFEDVIKLDDRALQRLMREVDSKTLAVALKTASEELKERIMGTMSQRARSALQEEMEFLGPQRLSDVEAAQAEIVHRTRELEESGEIVISGGDGDVLVE